MSLWLLWDFFLRLSCIHMYFYTDVRPKGPAAFNVPWKLREDLNNFFSVALSHLHSLTRKNVKSESIFTSSEPVCTKVGWSVGRPTNRFPLTRRPHSQATPVRRLCGQAPTTMMLSSFSSSIGNWDCTKNKKNPTVFKTRDHKILYVATALMASPSARNDAS